MGTSLLTEREKAVIRLAIYYPGKIPKQELYRLAYRGRYEDTDQIADVPAVATHWWNSKKVQGFYQVEKAAFDARREAERASIQAECETRIKAAADAGVESSKGVIIDYSRPENVRRKLNQIINAAKDSGEALDAIKLLLARQTEIAPEAQNPAGRQVRAYLPLQCYQCPLYLRERENLNK